MNAYEISCAQSLPVGKDCACSSTSATVHRVAAPHGGTDMFESLSTGALVLSAHNRLLRMNAAAEAMLGFSARNNIGVALADIVLDARKLENLARRSRTSQATVSDRELELAITASSTACVDCTATPLTDDTEGLEKDGVILEFHPIDRTRRISRDEHLLSQNEIARNVVRGLAHEIRNPLGGIRGAAQLLERELPSDELREYTAIIIGEAGRLQRLLDNLLGPRTVPEIATVNLHEVTERVVALINAEAGPAIHVERDYDPSIPLFDADVQMLIQSLLNIARNAVQAQAGRGCITVRTRIARQGVVAGCAYRMAARIDVLDDGPGVPSELADSLFFPLVTGRVDGTGLGLCIAQTLVQQHHGIIEYAREHGRTVFSILLPLDGAP
jgi:two-component system, NtrC family, nitrogen regulation sensor histidine kinase GlnL